MNASTATLERRLRPRGRSAAPRWGAARRAMQSLLDEPDATEHAFAVVFALDPDGDERRLEQMLRCEEGRRLFRERPSLQALLGDRAGLEALPAGSLGRAYLEHVDRHGLDVTRLVRLRRSADPDWERRDDGVRWFAERYELMHDLWHVVVGENADGRGEAVLLWFSWAQGGGRAGLFLAVGASTRMWRTEGPSAWTRTAWRAWRSGRRAACLLAAPWEELLPEPVPAVRALLRVT